ncbi:TrkH family potassium uptake protein [Echinimonas agarilytica]|uniref:Trk system potassium uptake protein n=1 Tax=Echinimonas agarilytica TaxID=1215918 RepID=A0AA42B5X2_9GAMM|nr:TrkH family potassium uptake protein [Echinimonas agarilytica]MCM2678069.1 TrkH family potassium uptake protein [Echinimonas agarilytica]
MEFRSLARILGILVTIFSVTMIPPALVSLHFKDGGGLAFTLAFFICLVIGLFSWLPNRNASRDLKAREGFLIVVLFWTVLGTVGAVPFLISESLNISTADAFFESFSGLTTTGATVLSGLDDLPKAILFYRQQLQWFGGMGIIVLAVAILPLLGVGGMQLYRAETPGPVKDSKMTPRIADTAQYLWYIYLSLTVACALAYYFAGMNWFDAICHSFSTIAIGGFSTHDASLGYFDSAAVNIVCVVFLLISGVNFALHHAYVVTRSLKMYMRDPELRTFIGIQVCLVLLCFMVLLGDSVYDSVGKTLDQALLQAVSMSTTAGFVTTDFTAWPLFLPILLMFASFIGGCAGSTGGGIKVIRVLLMNLQGIRELKRLVHPKAIYSIRLGRKPVPERVMDAVWGFFAAYALVFVIIMLGLVGTGMEEVSAFSATAATLNNLGPGLGEVAVHYGDVPTASKWLLIVAMLFGRLEVFTLLVLLTPAFWRN